MIFISKTICFTFLIIISELSEAKNDFNGNRRYKLLIMHLLILYFYFYIIITYYYWYNMPTTLLLYDMQLYMYYLHFIYTIDNLIIYLL